MGKFIVPALVLGLAIAFLGLTELNAETRNSQAMRLNRADPTSLGYNNYGWDFVNGSGGTADSTRMVCGGTETWVVNYLAFWPLEADTLMPCRVQIYKGPTPDTLEIWVPFGPDSIWVPEAISVTTTAADTAAVWGKTGVTVNPPRQVTTYNFPFEMHIRCDSFYVDSGDSSSKWSIHYAGY